MLKKKWSIVAASIAVMIIGIIVTFSLLHPDKMMAMELEAKQSFEDADYEKSVELYSKILEEDPYHVEARMRLAQSYAALSRLDEAEETLLDGIDLLPREASFYSSLSMFYMAQFKIDAALSTLQVGIDKTSDEDLHNEYEQLTAGIEIVSERTYVQQGFQRSLQLVWSDHNGEEVPLKADEWSLSDEKAAELEDREDSVIFYGKEPAEVTVVASIGEFEQTIDLFILEQVVEVLTFTEDFSESLPLAIGEEKVISIRAEDATGAEMSFESTWSTVNGLGSITSSSEQQATFNAEQEGLETIRVTVQDLTLEAEMVIDGQNKTILTKTEGNGTVELSPQQLSYTTGSEVTIQAIPAEGWEFVRWEGDLESSNQSETIVVNDHKRIKAIFSQNNITLAATHSVGGTIHSNKRLTQVRENDLVTLTAVPASGWRFVRWSGDMPSTERNLSLFMNRNYSVHAVFEQEQTTSNEGEGTGTNGNQGSANEKETGTDSRQTYTLSYTAGEGGSIQPSAPGSSFTSGSEVALTAHPKKGWEFVSWSGAATGTNPTITLTMSQDQHVTASFKKKENTTPEPQPEQTYTLSASTSGQGSVSPRSGEYKAGTNVTITATAESGWKFVRWQGDASGSSLTTSVTMNGNRNVTAVFEKIQVEVPSEPPTDGDDQDDSEDEEDDPANE
ncbi:hypothetical protein AJ85_18755 [Alkalihalobacillus alcalophilus ATCC 27647 = CGMCC 1.3604]|uniref:Bacterial repeat domain-containing protein n=1 Tax=Alkalihalobacillus alcalophilus ATCC 27647 = CGMCC 1.3604 TaxID=1218173 RepID=A0A094XAI4_ALKAL|nr:tetratricopeptide repeat protein [Alkalihalobacillus alcalophilus]KGA95770.1 hypothetical protein BALCAV_0220420 [Alkalihalobacillus alcalophilus ATCC 27647 = CGMCC 1.3604]MED1563832.1 InlB B-repeat-containing protein [Alkalihalobacillus alcalophilus]THG92048.1 hypothetical protein AJ85_18755 [Alkalihalobacillus alcalophilus ATCC 27647 = CGMCC 1.3604]